MSTGAVHDGNNKHDTQRLTARNSQRVFVFILNCVFIVMFQKLTNSILWNVFIQSVLVHSYWPFLNVINVIYFNILLYNEKSIIFNCSKWDSQATTDVCVSFYYIRIEMKFILMVEERLWEKCGSWVCNGRHHHIIFSKNKKIRLKHTITLRNWQNWDFWQIHKLNNNLCWSHKTVNNNYLDLRWM